MTLAVNANYFDTALVLLLYYIANSCLMYDLSDCYSNITGIINSDYIGNVV